METAKVKLATLRKVDGNVRKHSEQQIKEYMRSVEAYGQLKPLVIDEEGTILIGNGLYDALIGLGWTEADCYRVTGLTDKQKKKMMLSDNRVYELGETDDAAVAELLRELEGDTDIPGFDTEWLEEVYNSIDDIVDDEFELEENQRPLPPESTFNHTEINPDTDDGYDEEEHEVEARAQPGQIYRLGRHRLMCGDSTSVTDIQRLMGESKADLLLTDPPYNVDYEGTAGKIANDNMDDSSFVLFLEQAFSAAAKVLNPGSAFYIWHADSKGYETRLACHNAGLQIRQCLIWAKNSLVMGRQDYQWKHEPCLYGWTPGGKHRWYSDRKQTTILFFDKPQRNELHPTMKPVPLFDYLIHNSTAEGDAVLDLFAGSGTTIVACEQNNRTAFCMELDPHFVDVIIDRWEILTGQKAELIQ